MVEVGRVVDARGPQGVALQVQRLGAVGLRDAGVADQHVSQTTVCDMRGLPPRGQPGEFRPGGVPASQSPAVAGPLRVRMLDTHVVARSFTAARVHAVESSPAGERNHLAALAHPPEPPAASALVAATAGMERPSLARLRRRLVADSRTAPNRETVRVSALTAASEALDRASAAELVAPSPPAGRREPARDSGPVRSPVKLGSPARRARQPRGRGSTTPAPPAVLRWQTRRPPTVGRTGPRSGAPLQFFLGGRPTPPPASVAPDARATVGPSSPSRPQPRAADCGPMRQYYVGSVRRHRAMSGTTMKLTAAVQEYFADLRRVRASGGATQERSLYGPLGNLLTAIGATLRPKVFCVQELADQGAGHPDFGLYAAKQVQRGAPREAQTPERGVVEVKSPADDAWLTAEGRQASRYWGRYRLVLVTNARDFVLVGEDASGNPTTLETLRLASTEGEFLSRLEKPHAFARDAGASLGEYLARALSHRAALTEPKDLAWLLASYARDGLARVEAVGGAPQLAAVRSALEDALGIRFEGERGRRFFCSTLVQTLFYGIFSAWVLWARTNPAMPEPGRLVTGVPAAGRFDWHVAVWHLRAPVLRALFRQIADPGHLQPLGLTEVLDWTAAALDRVDRTAFFARFDQGEAVPYFYEPFLEAFDPDLRKQLGVWYTPPEVVRYMVARVDRALKDDLGIADGLAAENVYVLDPCCGTGAYLAEVLRRIAANLARRGLGALVGAGVKQAAMERVFGFEIMPAPFVVAHLQVGLTMQDLDAPLADDGPERAGVYLTNALTGWEPRTNKPLPFPELEEERDRAERVKQKRPILVILGNPPYNGFAGMAVDEERELSAAYRTTKRVRPPEGQGLNDLYVRFFRMAERRIAERTGRGVVCFISN